MRRMFSSGQRRKPQVFAEAVANVVAIQHVGGQSSLKQGLVHGMARVLLPAPLRPVNQRMALR